VSYSKISAARREGEAAAKALQDRLGPLSIPVPISEIAISQGCLVKGSPLEADLSGMAFIKNGLKVIIYNAAHHPNRQRFTIAHELAHHLLDSAILENTIHVDKGTLRRDNLSAEGTDKIEIRANAFAACLLMPEHLVRAACPQSIDLENDAIVAHLARRFGVSQAALTNRILNLSLD
jgi:Zn-dependent peptidase ImmA (M78 family)